MDFAENSEFLAEVKERLETDAGEIERLVTSIYNTIKALNANWSGDSYNEFSASCEGYRSSMEQLSTILKAFAYLIGEAGDNGTEIVEKAVEEALNTL